MSTDTRPVSQKTTARQWVSRWTISLTTPLTSLRMRNEIDQEMRLFAKRMPDYHAVVMSGVLHDLLATLDPEDPWLHLYKDDAGVVRLPGGEPFGTWENATDLASATSDDKMRDLSLSPMAEPLTEASVALIFHASHEWEEAREYMLERAPADEKKQSIFEMAEDAVRWALARRLAYAIDGDTFFPISVAAWTNRAGKIVAGEPFDEARMLRLRSGAVVESGAYNKIR
jgi:hypothetical protein